MAKKFNIRVYGICESAGDVLLSHEKKDGYSFTKFPGGGLEWGEGIEDCLKREFYEELGITIELHDIFYLTDYFQLSAFDKDDQLVSIYYRVFSKEIDTINTEDIPRFQEKEEVFVWQNINKNLTDMLTFPVDKLVGKILHNTS